jgi:hypothetical protein
MANKKHFKDPIAPRKREQHFPFQAPTKEKATTGFFFEAGDDYGIGFRNPTGNPRPPVKEEVVPMKSKCFPCEEAL